MNQIEKKFARKMKIKKKIIVKNNCSSIDSIHDDKIKYFNSLYTEILPLKEAELLKRKKRENGTSIAILEQEIRDIKEKKKENEYYLNVGSILMKYHILDEKIMLNIGKQDYDITVLNEEKKEIIKEYYNVLNIDTPNIFNESLEIDVNRCLNCNSDDSMIKTTESILCENCGNVYDIIIDDTPTYEERMTSYNPVYKVDYKRINYLSEQLTQIQAKENIDIPIEIIDKVILELNKKRISNLSILNIRLVREILKKIGFSKYYEHIPQIIYKINKLPPLRIPEQIENKLKYMFNELQKPYEIYKDPTRKNFFSYPYVISKCIEILEIPEFLPYFSLLKNREKLYKQDVTWKKIMTYFENNPPYKPQYNIPWRFIKSV